MNKDVFEVLRLFLAMAIMFVLCYCIPVYLIHCDDEDNDDHPTLPRGIKATGINPCVLRSIPVVAFNSRDFKDNVVCVVCLSDLADGDKAKVLPSCNHFFHSDCIDTWLLQSDTTCPICRNKVEELPLSIDPNYGEAYELLRDITAVVIDNIPAEQELERPLI